MRKYLTLLLLSGCVSPSAVLEWGNKCAKEPDPVLRRGIVEKIRSSGDPLSIPVLIDALEEALLRSKPSAADGPELEALHALTGESFGPDPKVWRGWWMKNQPRCRP